MTMSPKRVVADQSESDVMLSLSVGEVGSRDVPQGKLLGLAE